MSFLDLQKNEKPGAPVDLVELAVEALREDPERQAEYEAAKVVLEDKSWTNAQVVRAFRKLGFENLDNSRVAYYRRKVRERKVTL